MRAMKNNPLSLDNETERIKALHRYNILDTPPDGSFDRITAMASRLLKIPIAIVSLVDTDRIWFKSSHGTDVQEIDREPGLCASAIVSKEVYVIIDASFDVRCLTNPLVAGDFGLRFYAGVPLTTYDGYNLGTLCVIDLQPRSILPEELELLKDLAAVVMDEIELRLAARNVVKLNTALQLEIKERKRAESIAVAANMAKSEFLGLMSHELRTPLSNIIGCSQVIQLQCDDSLSPKQQKYLDIIKCSSEHLLALINDILEMSKIEVGKMTFNQSSFDLYCLLDNLEQMFQLKAQSKRLQLRFLRTQDVPQYVQTDMGKLCQILINLLENALKFTESGSVTLRIQVVSGLGVEVDRFEQLGAENERLKIQFEVEDTGPGIAPEEIDSLFEAFSQTSVGQKSQEGTGLGLAISRSFVQLLGGDITVNSMLGSGASFKFEILIFRCDSVSEAVARNERQRCCQRQIAARNRL